LTLDQGVFISVMVTRFVFMIQPSNNGIYAMIPFCIWESDRKKQTKRSLYICLYHMIKYGLKTVTVKTVDTDVIVLLVSFMPELLSYKPDIFVDFNFGD